MPRKKYDDAHGVVRLVWKMGNPPESSAPILVEVWRAETRIKTNDANRPQLSVHAQHEIHLFKDGKWYAMRYHGQLTETKPGEIRRWAELAHNWWHTTINIDGWNN